MMGYIIFIIGCMIGIGAYANDNPTAAMWAGLSATMGGLAYAEARAKAYAFRKWGELLQDTECMQETIVKLKLEIMKKGGYVL